MVDGRRKYKQAKPACCARGAMKKKYDRYQDYVIKDGKFVGDFDEMYRDFDDPWEQTHRERWKTEKSVALSWLEMLKDTEFSGSEMAVADLGCGLGHFTAKIAERADRVIGIDVSDAAVTKARANYPAVSFATGDILSFDILREFRPSVIVMAEITWYVLPMLERFLEFLRSEMKGAYVIHLLNTYPEGVQKYGSEFFTNLREIKEYFGLRYLESGEVEYSSGDKRTYFLGRV